MKLTYEKNTFQNGMTQWECIAGGQIIGFIETGHNDNFFECFFMFDMAAFDDALSLDEAMMKMGIKFSEWLEEVNNA